MMRALLVPPVLAAVACNAGSMQVDTAADEAAIRRMVEEHQGALVSGDVDQFLGYFSDDYEMMPPDAPTATGMDALRAFAAPLFDQLTMRQPVTFTDLRVAGDWAVGTYTYTFTATPKAGGPATVEEGKGIALFGRQPDGSWKWTRGLWNRNAPATPVTASTTAR